MTYKGMFHFNKNKHAGECEVNDKNNIIITINESDLLEVKGKITGYANNELLTIYAPILIDYGVGYYKLQAYYMVKHRIPFKIKNVDFSKHIRKFRFTFEPLDEWLGYKTIEEKDGSILFNLPKDIILYDKDGLNIKIKYFKEDIQIQNNSINSINVIPYISVTSTKDLNVEKVKNYIQMISRFFATLLGYTNNIRHIKFIKEYKGKTFFEKFEDDLIINCDFSNCYDNSIAYSTYNLRTYYQELKEDLKGMFEKWFKLYTNSRFQEIFIYYFSPYKSKTIENEFLDIVKCIEKVSLSKENKKEQNKRNNELHNLLKQFYEKHKTELEKNLKDSGFKKKYVKNINEIHEQLADSIVYSYSNRVDLAQRIKKIDTNKMLLKIFKVKHITKQKNNKDVYYYLANTRNYYTHLDNGQHIIKDIFIPMYCRILEKLFIIELLKLIIGDKKYIQNKIKQDRYLTVYDNRN